MLDTKDLQVKETPVQHHANTFNIDILPLKSREEFSSFKIERIPTHRYSEHELPKTIIYSDTHS